jgi:hypothetical protein
MDVREQQVPDSFLGDEMGNAGSSLVGDGTSDGSMEKVPMKGKNNEEIPLLAFGIAREKRRLDEVLRESEGDIATSARSQGKDEHKRQSNNGLGLPSSDGLRETFEQVKMKETFEQMKMKALEDKQNGSTRASFQESRLVDRLFQSAKSDLGTLVKYVEQAEASSMIDRLDGKAPHSGHEDDDEAAELLCTEILEPLKAADAKDAEDSRDTSRDSEDSLLECKETLDDWNEVMVPSETQQDSSETSNSKREEDTSAPEPQVSIARDVAIIRGLTRLIQTKALESARLRIAKEKIGHASRIS